MNIPLLLCLFVRFCLDSPRWARASSFTRFLDYTQRRTTVGRTSLDEWSARRRDLYLKTHNTHKRQTSMTPVGFEPTISVGKRPHTYALDRPVTGIGLNIPLLSITKFSFDHSACPVILNLSLKFSGNMADDSLLHRYRFHLCTV
jgi:hypothetical protein